MSDDDLLFKDGKPYWSESWVKHLGRDLLIFGFVAGVALTVSVGALIWWTS